jgi:hypothetical protein
MLRLSSVLWSLTRRKSEVLLYKITTFGSCFFFFLQVMGVETPTHLGPFDRPNLNHWIIHD